MVLAPRSSRRRASARAKEGSVRREAYRPDAGLRAQRVKGALVGYRGKVGSRLAPASRWGRHEVTPIGREDPIQITGHERAVNFTRPTSSSSRSSEASSRASRTSSGQRGSACEEQTALGELAREQGVQLFVRPNFASRCGVRMRFAREAGRILPRSEIIELAQRVEARRSIGHGEGDGRSPRRRHPIPRCACRGRGPPGSALRASGSPADDRSATTRTRVRRTSRACC